MARAATTSDVFNAIAEPTRREILELLARCGSCAVSVIVDALRMPQPAVSKHLSVLRKVGLVSAVRQSRQRLYRLEAGDLKVVHDWAKAYEPFWDHQLDRIKARAELQARKHPGVSQRRSE